MLNRSRVKTDSGKKNAFLTVDTVLLAVTVSKTETFVSDNLVYYNSF